MAAHPEHKSKVTLQKKNFNLTRTINRHVESPLEFVDGHQTLPFYVLEVVNLRKPFQPHEQVSLAIVA